MRLMKLMSLGSLLLFTLISSGCGEIHSDYTVNQDGSLNISNEVSVSPSAKNIFPEVSNALDEEAENGKNLGYNVSRTDNGLTEKKHLELLMRQ